ncbi:MAG: ATP-binding protein [Firmicutes bacterium]|nr:ATP-binding protein [Bacillota bacterium]
MDALAGNKVFLRIPSKPEYVGIVRLAISGIANRLRFSYEDTEDLKLAVAEACNSAIHHAKYIDDILVDCEVKADMIIITVKDSGKGTDKYKEKVLPESSENDEKMGLFLIETLMDSVEHRIEPHGGLFIRMVKKLTKGETIERQSSHP